MRSPVRPRTPDEDWRYLTVPNSKNKNEWALRVLVPPMKTLRDFRYEGERVYSEAEDENDEGTTVTYPSGQGGVSVYDAVGLRVRVRSVPIAVHRAEPQKIREFFDLGPSATATKTRGLTIYRDIAAYPATNGIPAEKLRRISVVRFEPQPVQVEVAASPEHWGDAEAILKSMYAPPDIVVEEDLIHPFIFKGRTLPLPTEGTDPQRLTASNGFRYEYASIDFLCRLDVQAAPRFDLAAARAEFKSLDLERGVRFGTGATWLHLRGVALDGRPTHLLGARFGGSNVVARISLPPGKTLPAEIDGLTSQSNDPAPVTEAVDDDMFERNVIVSRREIDWGDKPLFRVDSLPLTLSGATATFSVNENYEIKGTVARSVEPFDENAFRQLENELPLDTATFLLHAVRSDGFESFVFDSRGQYGRGWMNYFMQRPQTPALTVKISNDAGFSPPFWDSMEVADPIKGWISFGWPGDDLPKGFAYYWTDGRPIRDGLWIAAPYPMSWRVKTSGKGFAWSPDGTGQGVNRFSIADDKLFVYGLPPGRKLDDKGARQRVESWATLTGAVLANSGRWERLSARGQVYDVFKTSATREGVEREVWHFRGLTPKNGEEQHTFLLEFKSSDAPERDAWLKLNEVPPPPMRRPARI